MIRLGRLSTTVERIWQESDAHYRDQILALAPSGEALLDVGCDDGTWTMKVAEAVGAKSVAGIEVTDARHSAMRLGIDARPADLENQWPFDADSFDVVHANQVIEHVKRLDHFVLETARVLRPGGRS